MTKAKSKKIFVIEQIATLDPLLHVVIHFLSI